LSVSKTALSSIVLFVARAKCVQSIVNAFLDRRETFGGSYILSFHFRLHFSTLAGARFRSARKSPAGSCFSTLSSSSPHRRMACVSSMESAAESPELPKVDSDAWNKIHRRHPAPRSGGENFVLHSRSSCPKERPPFDDADSISEAEVPSHCDGVCLTPLTLV
jgi:hypothetical protein